MSIYKRNWKHKGRKETVRYYFDETIDGVRHQILIKSARTSTQAKDAVRKILADIHDGQYGNKSRQTFKEAAEVYIDWAKDHKQSWKTDRAMVEPMIERFGKKKLSQISANDIEKYRAERRKVETHGTSRAISTLNKELKILSKIFKMAKVKDNPCREVEKLKNEVRRTRYLSVEEE